MPLNLPDPRYHAAASTTLSWGLAAGLVASFAGWVPAIAVFGTVFLAMAALMVWYYRLESDA